MDQQRGRFAVVAALAAAVILCTSALAQPSRFRLETVSAWGGAVNAFQRVGNIGYCGSGQRLVVLDMSNEAAIQEIGSINLVSTVQDLLVRGQHVFVLTQSAPYALVVDVSMPSAPRLVWSATGNFRYYVQSDQRIRPYGNLAYLSEPGGIAHLCDITNPALPVLIETYPNYYQVEFGSLATGGRVLARDLQIVGNYAYVAGTNLLSSTAVLSIFNLQPDPRRPAELIGSVVIPNNANVGPMHIAVANGRAVVQAKSSENQDIVYIVDVSNPASPVLRSSYADVFDARGVAIQGNLVFVADWLHDLHTWTLPWPPVLPPPAPLSRLKGLAVLDISDPSSPTLLGTYNTSHSSIFDVRVDGTRAYLFCEGQGLEVLDIANPAQPTRVGGYYSPSSLRLLNKQGNLLYAVDEWNGFSVLDVGDPAAPAVQNVYRSSSPNSVFYRGHWGLQIQGNRGYLAAGHSGIHVLDFTDPVHPAFLGQYAVAGRNFEVRGVELDGSILHASMIVDTPCPEPPHGIVIRPVFTNFIVSEGPPYLTEVGTYDPCPPPLWPPMLMRMKSLQGITFGAGPGLGKARMDNRIATQPRPLYPDGDSLFGVFDLELSGTTLYSVFDSSAPPGRLQILDVTDPLPPQLPVIASMLIPMDPGWGAVDVSVGRAFISCQNFPPGSWRVIAVDVSNPATPAVLTGSFAGPINDIEAEGDLAYMVASGHDFYDVPAFQAGLIIQRFRCYANCDLSTTAPVLNVADFGCFLNKFAAGDSDANCDGSTAAPALNVQDFSCFLNLFAAGCN